MHCRPKIFLALIVTLFLGNIRGSHTIHAVKGNITTLNDVDVIVNAANPQLAGGGAGVCGAIFTAADTIELQKKCNLHPETAGIRCPVGEARITDSCNLKSQGIKYIIHAVGPDARIINDQKQQFELLKKAYLSSLMLAEDHTLLSIAFPTQKKKICNRFEQP